MRTLIQLTMMTLAVLLVAGEAIAQGRGGRGGFGGRQGGMQASELMLLGIDAVASDLGLSDEQKEQITALREEQRGARGERGDRPNYRDMSDEERQSLREKMQKEREERQSQATEKLSSILDATQTERLGQIALQLQGARALLDAKVQSKLELSEETVAKLSETSQEVNESMREKMGELFRSGDRSTMREKMEALRKESSEKILAVLSDSERQAFTDLQGEKLEISQQDLRGGRGGFGGRQGRQGGPGGQGGNRRERASRPELE